MKKRLLMAIVLQLILSSCASILTLSNEVVVKDDPRVRFKSDNHYLIAIGESHKPFQSYDIKSKSNKARIVLIGYQKCWHATLAGLFIPIPFVPSFRVPHNYSIQILSNPFWNKEVEYNFLSTLEVSLVADGVTHKAALKRRLSEAFFSYEVNNFEFPIACNAFNEAAIVIKEPSIDEVKFNIERDTNFYYRWIVAN